MGISVSQKVSVRINNKEELVKNIYFTALMKSASSP